MQGDFELNKMGWYEAQNVEENDFLNDRLDNDQYGIYYNVKFAGDAETYLWQAKSAPVEGEKYWGHIEPSKSGKSLRFKKDKLPEGSPVSGATQGGQDARGDSITASMCVKLAFSQFCHVEAMLPNAEEHWQMIEYMSDMLYKTIKKTGVPAAVKAVFPEAQSEPLPPEPEDLGQEEAEPSRDWHPKGH